MYKICLIKTIKIKLKQWTVFNISLLNKADSDTCYPVFPLNTVFFPGCKMGLRIFEQRYLRMISETSKSDLPFVISLIGSKADKETGKLVNEVGSANACHEIACLARISDFNQSSHGVLDVVVRAGARVKLSNCFHEKDNLMQASLEDFSESELMDVPEPHQSMLKIFDALKNQDPYLLKENSATLSATELSFYLSHLVPVPLYRKQQLLEINDTNLRLQALENIFSKLQTTLMA